MTPAQTVALRRCAEADGPVKIAPATAAVLSERYHFIERDGDWWKISDKGRGYLAAEDFDRRHRDTASKLSREARQWADRIDNYFKTFHRLGYPDRGHYNAQRYAGHYAACLFDGLEPVRPAGELAWIEHEVDLAAEGLRSYDREGEKAAALGTYVEISWKTAKAHPKAKPAAAEPRPDGTVDLRSYRLRRGLDVDGGPAA